MSVGSVPDSPLLIAVTVMPTDTWPISLPAHHSGSLPVRNGSEITGSGS
jgi:hypothetical protein